MQGRRPSHAIDRAHPVEIGVAHRLGVIRLFDHRVADPDRRADVMDRRIRPTHDAEEDRSLLGHEQGGEGQAAEEHRQLGAISKEHVQGEAIHEGDL